LPLFKRKTERINALGFFLLFALFSMILRAIRELPLRKNPDTIILSEVEESLFPIANVRNTAK